MNWSTIKYFGRGEFDDPDFPGSGKLIGEDVIERLDLLRKVTGWAIIPHGKVGGCVDVNGTHGHSKRSYHLKERGCKACNFHFADPKTFKWLRINTRLQYYEVEEVGFGGIGIYRDWVWNGECLPIGFHVDTRPTERMQRWRRENGKYLYLL